MGRLDELKARKKLYEETVERIRRVYLADDIPWVIGYSGGKDSTCTTQIVLNTLIDMAEEGIELSKKVYIISSDTLVENPMLVSTIVDTIAAINKLAVAKRIPVEAKVIRPAYSRGFWANVIGRGYPVPNQTFRWCTDRMKIEPANKFITSVVSSYGKAIMVLGVRYGESGSRDRVLESHYIEGKEVSRHSTLNNAFVFSPIDKFDIEDVWNYLLEHESPWGSDNHELYRLYRESSEDCPLMIDEATKNTGSCGNSRFGCWVCTVVSKDKSLTGFIENGVEWLRPLLEFRNWLYSIRDLDDTRMRRRSNGTIYFTKIKTNKNNVLEITQKGNRDKVEIAFDGNNWIDSNGCTWNYFEGQFAIDNVKKFVKKNKIDLSSGEDPKILVKLADDSYATLGKGPFTMKMRQEILRRLLELQKSLENGYELIKVEELTSIRNLWLKDGDWEDSLSKVYYEVYGTEFNINDDDIRLFDHSDLHELKNICDSMDYNYDTFLNLIMLEKENSGYLYRSDVLKGIQKELSQEYLFIEKEDEDSED